MAVFVLTNFAKLFFTTIIVIIILGDKAAQFTGSNLHYIVGLEEAFTNRDFGKALKDGFLSADRALLIQSSFRNNISGCTATTAIIADGKIIVANAGDSRTVLGIKGTAKPMSFDHKPQNEGERRRIVAAGGFVESDRVNGNLALSRAIGDFDFKKCVNKPPEEQVVTADPDINIHQITKDDEFLVLACDGIWDVMESQEVVEFVRRGIASRQELSYICENIMDKCLAPATDTSGLGCDNMTIMIVGLLNNKTKEQWYDMICERVANGDGPVAPESSAEAFGIESEEEEVSEDDTDGEFQEVFKKGGAPGTGLSLHQLLGSGAFLDTKSDGTIVVKTSTIDKDSALEKNKETSDDEEEEEKEKNGQAKQEKDKDTPSKDEAKK